MRTTKCAAEIRPVLVETKKTSAIFLFFSPINGREKFKIVLADVNGCRLNYSVVQSFCSEMNNNRCQIIDEAIAQETHTFKGGAWGGMALGEAEKCHKIIF